ncbi:MAG: hypothetical protein QOC94_3260 [Actinoplanes sp.]|jgi:hypothetical protein|nr:hypothetical protein [Actinoplanes sp.]MDT5033089.1 hypothetical protein [Actinoplanes sp.]
MITDPTQLTHAQWRKSTRSSSSGNCVEVATNLSGAVAVRDTKDKGTGPVLLFTPAEWEAFTAGVKDNEFNL